MPTLHMRFPGGRYHATPSGHHVNEGMIEWPPSPWRLLRALIATGYAALGWKEVPEVATSMIEKMASVLPTYRLPQACAAHSRHYMPLGVLDKGREKTTLVYDTWADVGQGVLAVSWKVEFESAERELLSKLVSTLAYLGRAESWVEAELVDDAVEAPVGSLSVPCDGSSSPGPQYQQVSVLAPLAAEEYARWRSELVRTALDDLPLPPSKKPTKKLLKQRERAEAAHPVSLLDALQWDTARWKAHRWGQAPGSRRVLYWRRADALEVGVPPRRRVVEARSVDCMLFALATTSRNRSALPTVERTLPQADLMHRALVSRVGEGDGVPCPELTGRDAQGNPLCGHRHARILPVDLDGDGHLDHVLVHARMGLGARAQQAARSLRRTWQKRGQELQVVVVGAGALDDLRGLPEALRDGVEKLLGPLDGATTWESATPFVPPRFLKRRGANDLVGQVRKELENHGHAPARVEIIGWNSKNARQRHAVRVRSGSAKPPPIDCGFAIRLVFDESVSGPIALGYGSHYGLGVFHAIR